MTKFVPISALGEDAILSPEFYVAADGPRPPLEARGGLVALLPPINQEDVLANATLLAIFDAEIASRPKGTSFVLVQTTASALGENSAAPTANLKYFQWNGSAFDTRQFQVAKPNVDALVSLVEEEGIISKTATDAGISGAIPNPSSIRSAIESFPIELLPFFSPLRPEWGDADQEGDSPWSRALRSTSSKWLHESGAFDGLFLKPAPITDELREAVLIQLKSYEDALASARAGKVPSTTWQPHTPGLGLVKLSARFFGSDFFLAFTARSLSRDSLVQFMDALGLRLQEQQNFLERCWQIIGTEISSRVRHMFKNRVGSAYDEIKSITRVATDMGWIAALTAPPEVIRVQQELHHDSDDYYQVGAHLRRIQENLKALERAVDQLSKFYRGIRGEPELLSVNAAIEKQLTNWRAARPDVEISKELDPVNPTCLIAPDCLTEILDNIFGNSQKFVPRKPGHHIFVTTKLRRDKVLITISNDGPATLPDHPTKLFETTDPQGAGVGLHLVDRWVSEAGGTFTIALRPDGPGVTNKIELPNPSWKAEL